MTYPASKRRSRFIPLVGATTVTLGLLFANLDGFHDPLTHKHFGFVEYVTEPPFINWAHGWPFAYVLRHNTDSAKPGVIGFTNPVVVGGPLQGYVGVAATPSRSSRWPFDSARFRVLHWWRLLADIGVFIGIIWGSYRGLQFLQQLPGLRLQFSLRQLMLAMLLVAIWASFRTRINWQYVVFPRFAFAAVFAGGLLTTLTLASGVQTRHRSASTAQPKH